MVTEIIPEKNLDVFEMMEIVLSHTWKVKEEEISISGIETNEDLDNLLNNGIRIEYANDTFMNEILTDLNKKRFDFSIKYKN